MLDPWIIEEIRRREESVQDEGRRLELPLENPTCDDRGSSTDEAEERGVVVIDL